MCGKSKNRDCKGCYLEEKLLIEQFQKLIDTIDLHDISIKEKIKKDITRIKKFQQTLLGITQDIQIQEIDLKNYAKFILKDGEIEEKRELLGCFNGKIILKNKKIFIFPS